VPRFVVIEGASSAQPARRAIAEFQAVPQTGWQGAPGRLCVGVVRTEDEVQRVVLAALAGADLVVDCRVGREAADLMCDDLRRLGTLDHRIVDPDAVTLDDDQRALLAAIAEGASLGQAAADLHLSRRTADRRLAAARKALDAASTPEAVVKATRLGLLGPGRRPG
jgi:DNA-binding NarL/FixJ family response regulator